MVYVITFICPQRFRFKCRASTVLLVISNTILNSRFRYESNILSFCWLQLFVSFCAGMLMFMLVCEWCIFECVNRRIGLHMYYHIVIIYTYISTYILAQSWWILSAAITWLLCVRKSALCKFFIIILLVLLLLLLFLVFYTHFPYLPF